MEEGGVYVTTISSMGDMIMPLLNPVRSRKGRFVIVKASGQDLDHIRSLVEAGKVKPVIDRDRQAERKGSPQRGDMTSPRFRCLPSVTQASNLFWHHVDGTTGALFCA
jgi:hypothetical protein